MQVNNLSRAFSCLCGSLPLMNSARLSRSLSLNLGLGLNRNCPLAFECVNLRGGISVASSGYSHNTPLIHGRSYKLYHAQAELQLFLV